MKNIFFIIAFLSTTTIFAQEETNVFWIHGLGGDINAWIVYDEFFGSEEDIVPNSDEPRPIRDFRVDYTMDGVVQDAKSIEDDLIQLVPIEEHSNPNNIAFCHSMGGAVARQLYGTNVANPEVPNFFEKAVFVGTQFKGAPLAENAINGRVTRFLKDACPELLAGPLSEAFSFLFSDDPNITIISIGQELFMSGICNFLINETLESETVAGFLNQSTADIRPSSPFMSELLELEEIPITISFYGVEESPRIWRTFSSLIGPSSVLGVGEGRPSYLPRDITNDEILVEAISGFNSLYYTRMQVHILNGLFSQKPWARLINFYQARQYQKGIDWIEDSDPLWHELVGSITSDQVPSTVLVFDCEDQENEIRQLMLQIEINGNPDPNGPTWNQLNNALNALQNNPDCYREEEGFVTMFFQDDNDGIVPSGTQFVPGALSNWEVEGANHFEERNHPNATSLYTELFNGDLNLEFEIK